MAYNSDTGIITAPISMADVQRCFGLSSRDIGTLITNARINKWAKYKPVVSRAINTVGGQWDANNNKWLDSATWYKGDDGSCGLSYSVFTSMGSLSNSSSFLYKLVNNQLPWSYKRPTGGGTSPYRLQDFACYNHNAEPIIGRLAGAGRTIYVSQGTSSDKKLTLNYDMPTEEDNLSLSDFAYNGVSFRNYYLGVVMVKGSTYIIVTSDSPIGNSGAVVINTTISGSDTGTWKVYPFLSSVKLSRNGSIPEAVYLSAGYENGTTASNSDTINIQSASSILRIDVSAQWTNSSYNRVGITATIVNDNSTSKTFGSGITFYVYETDESASTGASGTLVGSYNYNKSITVGAHNSVDLPTDSSGFTCYIGGLTRKNGKEYWITARPNDGTIIDNVYEPVQDDILL